MSLVLKVIHWFIVKFKGCDILSIQVIINSNVLICSCCHFQGIILVYDITTEDSFKHIAQWLQNIQDVSTVRVETTIN